MSESQWEQVCNLSEHTLKVLDSFGFKTMTSVQIATIPAFMRNKDVCVEAVTGSGKTLSFLVPLLEILLRRRERFKKQEVGGIIISPTRELASQIFEVLSSFYDVEKCPFTASLMIGGRGEIERDLKEFEEKGSNIIVATPGRISSALEKSVTLRSGVRSLDVLILDEADRLLDLGFHKTLSTILGYLPKQRRTGLFSATQTSEVEQLVKAGMRNPVKISVKEKASKFESTNNIAAKTPSSLSNQYVMCTNLNKFNFLMDFILKNKDEKMLIFFSTCASVDYFGRAIKDLIGTGLNILLLHGKIKKKRLDIFSDFRKLTSGMLICTDVMARGVDIPEVDWVLQYDPPSNASAFVHRCGRTARVGRRGSALVFLLESENSYVDFIEINQKAPMLEYTTTHSYETDWLAQLRHLAEKDRATMDRGTRAFVSFVQAYAKHECSLIFRLKDLNLGALASGFALLRLPRMPELKNKTISDFEETKVDFSSIPYKDKMREKQRLSLKRESVEKTKYVSKKQKAWSQNKDKKETRKVKKEKKKMKKLKIEFNEDEYEELRKDAQLVKKMKNKKITKEDCDRQLEIGDTTS